MRNCAGCCAEATSTVGCAIVLKSLRSERFYERGVSKRIGPEMESVGDQRASPAISKTVHFQQAEGGGGVRCLSVGP
jgi:hypothetical protein